MWDVQQLLLLCIGWEITFHVVQFCASRAPLPASFPVNTAPSYILSLFHALIISSRGMHHFLILLPAPLEIKMAPIANLKQFSDAFESLSSELQALEFTCLIFISYLIYDMIHVVFQWPRLGTFDVLLHHFAFLIAACVALNYQIMHFPFSWLVICELSTVFLNVRWLALKLGLPEKFVTVVSILMAILFGLTRVVLYGVGLAHLIMNLNLIVGVPKPVLIGIVALLTGGYGVQIFWFRKIVLISMGRGRTAMLQKQRKVAVA
mmetsp:Transcript_3768/g.6588  ORF Transcript_3768/g.6588 Transcript_3768/m.6588 type:complete len:263 (+) Transcript_3768:163-951(+)